MYVTKKQVSSFIIIETDRLKISESELKKEVGKVLTDLNEFPEDNKNQIKFYNRVYNKLNQ